MAKFRIPDHIRKKVGPFSSRSQTIGYQIAKHNIPSVWSETKGEGITVAILDTGCDQNHEDLIGSFSGGINLAAINDIKSLRGKINTTRNNNLKKQLQSQLDRLMSDFTDRDNHGSHVTGIVTANNNELGIVGVAPEAKVLTIKVLGDDGSGSFDAIIAGIDEAIARKADIINMSLGSPSGNEKLRLAIKRAYDRNIPIVCAAGNAGVTRLDFPACYPETISVGALDPKNIKASFSQMGPNLDFVAPGVDILSTIPGNGYMCMSGTSQATPWVTGIIALMLSKHKKDQGDTPINNVEDVRNHLRKVAIDIDAVGKDDKTGFGLIDVKNLFSQFSAKNISVEDRLTMMEQRILTIEKHLFPS